MIADGLTKTLTPINHKIFIKIIGLKDQKERLISIKLEKDQSDVFLLYRTEQNSKAFGYGVNTSWYVQGWSIRAMSSQGLATLVLNMTCRDH